MMWGLPIREVVGESPFYLNTLGLDQPIQHIWTIGVASLALIVELLLVALVCSRLRGSGRVGVTNALAGFVGLHMLGMWVAPVPALQYWLYAPAVLPPLVVLTAGLGLASRLGSRRLMDDRPLLCWLATFAGLMLLKLGLLPRVYYCGFAQALPATIVLVIVLVGALPRRLASSELGERFVQGAMASIVIAFGLFSMQRSLTGRMNRW